MYSMINIQLYINKIRSNTRNGLVYLPNLLNKILLFTIRKNVSDKLFSEIKQMLK